MVSSMLSTEEEGKPPALSPTKLFAAPSSGYCSTILLTKFAALTHLSAQAKRDEQLETIQFLSIVTSSQERRISGVVLICVFHCTKYVFEKGKFLEEYISQ